MHGSVSLYMRNVNLSAEIYSSGLLSLFQRLTHPYPPSVEGHDCQGQRWEQLVRQNQVEGGGAMSVLGTWTCGSFQVWGPETSGPSLKLTGVEGPHCPTAASKNHQDQPMSPSYQGRAEHAPEFSQTVAEAGPSPLCHGNCEGINYNIKTKKNQFSSIQSLSRV